MDRPQIVKWFRRHLWLVLSGLGVFLGLSLFLGQYYPVPILLHTGLAKLQDLSNPIPAVATAASPLASPLRSGAKASTPLKPVSPSPQPTVLPSAVTALSPEQEAINRRNKAEFEASLPTVDSLIEMRVAIAEGIASTILIPTTNAAVLNREGTPLQTLTAGKTYAVQADSQSLQLNGSRLPPAIMIDPGVGTFYLGDRSYRGRLLLIADGNNLWAVNLVSMRSYLYSVVGSEVYPDWDMNALKAQAVAARSYALTYYFRPVNEIYHLGATERYQVYKGTERETDTTRQSVDETAGEFVSRRGDIVESLYAASDDIVMEAFAGQGMSQIGAQGLAKEGYPYKQILSHYYPGTGVGRISQDLE